MKSMFNILKRAAEKIRPLVSAAWGSPEPSKNFCPSAPPPQVVADAGVWEAAMQANYPTIAEQLRYWLSSLDRDPSTPTKCELRESCDGDEIFVWLSKSSDVEMRVGMRTLVDCLSVSGVFLSEALRGRGWLARFIVDCALLNPWPRLVLETVIEPRLVSYFQRLGFETPYPELPTAFLVSESAARRLQAIVVTRAREDSARILDVDPL